MFGNKLVQIGPETTVQGDGFFYITYIINRHRILGLEKPYEIQYVEAFDKKNTCEICDHN